MKDHDSRNSTLFFVVLAILLAIPPTLGYSIDRPMVRAPEPLPAEAVHQLLTSNGCGTTPATLKQITLQAERAPRIYVSDVLPYLGQVVCKQPFPKGLKPFPYQLVTEVVPKLDASVVAFARASLPPQAFSQKTTNHQRPHAVQQQRPQIKSRREKTKPVEQRIPWP